MSYWLSVAGGLARIVLAGTVAYFCWLDWPAIQMRQGFDALPDYDYYARATELLDQERFSEALLVVDAGIEATPEPSAPLGELRARIETERSSWMHRFQQIGEGALKGTGQSAEALGGAIVADLFVFGDVRDLVIQAGNRIRGREVDRVIVALSAGGILLTVSPALDLGSALLKFARRMGVMSKEFARTFLEVIRRAVKNDNADEVLQVTADMATLSRQARPAGAMTIFRHIDSPADLRLAAAFSERAGGAFTLWVGGKSALALLKEGGELGSAWVVKAARKGKDGLAYLARHGDVMLRPHAILGIVKGFYKGNIPAAIGLFVQRYSIVFLGLAVAWLACEIVAFGAGLGRERRIAGEAPPRAATGAVSPRDVRRLVAKARRSAGRS